MADLQQIKTVPVQGARLHGRCKFFNHAKAWGFITAPDGEEIFVHQNECRGLLPNEGQRVTYELGRDARGRRQAVRVSVVIGGNDPQ